MPLPLTCAKRAEKSAKADPLTGSVAKDENGKDVWIPGSLKCVKGIGWFIEEYGVCQISMNLTNINITPVHVAFDECVAKVSRSRRACDGQRVGGSGSAPGHA